MLLIKRCSLYTFALLFLIACKPSRNTNLENSTGKPGSLVVTADKAVLNDLKAEIDNAFLTPLPTGEDPFLELLRPALADFNQFFFNKKTILVLVVNGNTADMGDLLSPFEEDPIENYTNKKEAVIVTKSDVLAKNQHIVYLFAPDMATLKSKLITDREALINLLIGFELADRQKEIFSDSSSVNTKYATTFKEKYGMFVKIPSDYKVIRETSNFYWFQKDIANEKGKGNIGLIVHAYPYKDSNDLTYTNMRSMRDSFCKYNIPGELPGTYMSTSESETYPKVITQNITIAGHKGVKIKGWWTIKGIAMSGPYVRYVIQVPEQNSIFVFEGFIYKDVLEFKEGELRTIEAIALTIQ
ncbi:MAG: DUF4837 family protein [Bacteroidota bacterium]